MPTEIHQQLKGLINNQADGTVVVPIFLFKTSNSSVNSTKIYSMYVHGVCTIRLVQLCANETRENVALWRT